MEDYTNKTCPFCRTKFKVGDDIVVCSSCGMPHHRSCWEENGNCTTFGCTGTMIALSTTSQNSNQTSDSADRAKSPQEGAQAKRFETVFSAEPLMIYDGIPVLIESITLILDTVNQSLMARCIFRSISDKPIQAMLVDVKCTDEWGNECEGVTEFQFLDLKTKNNTAFGQKTPIPIPNNNTRVVSVVIKKVLFSDRTMIEGTGAVSSIPKQSTLNEFFGSDGLANEYVRRTNEFAKDTVVCGEKYWRCACGYVNPNAETICQKCNSEKESLVTLLSKEVITESLDAYNEERLQRLKEEQAARDEQIRQAEERMRLEKEENERIAREEKERKRSKRKKTAKKIGIITAGIVLVAFIVYAIGWQLIPFIKYTNGKNFLKDKAYDEAYECFVQLGDYKDSKDKATDTLYQKALSLMSSKKYLEAAETFEKIPDYKDSKEQATKCRNEDAYLAAKKLFNDGKFKSAAEAFTALGSYLDSETQSKMSYYEYGKKLFNDGKYKTAYEVFFTISGYEDATDLANKSCYSYAKRMYKEKKYKTASKYFQKIPGYKDSDSLFKKSYYNHGLNLLKQKKYCDAVTVFTTLGDYKKSKSNCNKAMYAYVLEHKYRSDTTTYSYLKRLKSAGYRDSKSIYNKLYMWYATVVINDSPYSTTDKSTISKYSSWYFHVTLHGGPPGESILVKYRISGPDYSSSDESGYFSKRMTDGSSDYVSYSYTYPSLGSTGDMYFFVYDASTGDPIGFDWVYVGY